MVPHVVTDAAAEVHLKVVAARVIVARETAGAIREIEASALASDAAKEIKTDLLAKAGLVHGVEVVQDGTKGLTARSAVCSLGSLPGRLKVEADALVEDDIRADGWVEASFFGAEAGTEAAGSGGHHRAAAERNVALLGGREMCGE